MDYLTGHHFGRCSLNFQVYMVMHFGNCNPHFGYNIDGHELGELKQHIKT